ncbi:MAG: hypothetical protein ABIY51_04490 [Ferruginibacter sp.]
MINYRVADLKALVEELKKEAVIIVEKIEIFLPGLNSSLFKTYRSGDKTGSSFNNNFFIPHPIAFLNCISNQ